MDRLSGIIRCQWQSYWRRLSRARSLSVGHEGITTIIAAIVLFRYLSLLPAAGADLAKGDTGRIQVLLTVILLSWLLLPISASSAGIPFRGLLHLPLSLKELFVIRISSLVITPYSWVVLAATFAICYPLAHAQRSLFAITAALLLFSTSCLAGIALAHVLTRTAWRRLLFSFLVVAAIASYIVAGTNQSRLISAIVLPIDLVTTAALGANPLVSLGVLMSLNVVALSVAIWPFHMTLRHEGRRSSRRGISSALFRLPTAAGTLAAKDVRYFRTLLDPYFGVIASALGCLYLLSANEPSIALAWLFTSLVFISSSPLAFNSFGFESANTLDRYALMPATGLMILRAKNLAFVFICLIQVAPITLLTFWRLGFAAGVIHLLAAASTAAAYLAWGNWMSLAFPARMHPFRFSSSTGSLVEIMAGVFFGTLPGALVIYLLRLGGFRAVGLALAVLIAFVALHVLATNRYGKRFDHGLHRLSLSLKLR